MSNFNDRGEIIHRRPYSDGPSGDPPPRNPSGGKGRFWIILVCAVIAGVMYLYAQSTNSQPTATPVSTRIDSSPRAVSASGNSLQASSAVSDSVIGAVVVDFFQIKARVLRTLNASEYARVLRGSALEKRLLAVDTLRSKNCYWDIASVSVQVDNVELLDRLRARAVATVQEDANLYCNGSLDRGSYHEPYRMSFELELVEGQWYITEQHTLE